MESGNYPDVKIADYMRCGVTHGDLNVLCAAEGTNVASIIYGSYSIVVGATFAASNVILS